MRDHEIKERWIKLAPMAVHVTNTTEAKLVLNEVGKWKVTATYHPPQGSFSPKYTSVLQAAAHKAGCEVPKSLAEAEPKIITVLAQ